MRDARRAATSWRSASRARGAERPALAVAHQHLRAVARALEREDVVLGRRPRCRSGAARCRAGASRRGATTGRRPPRRARPRARGRRRRPRPPRSAAPGCVEQRGALALDQRGVEVGVRERRGSARRGAGTRRWSARRRCGSAPARRRAGPAPAARSRAADDQLGDHRVVVRRDRVALAHAAVDPHLRIGAARELDRRRQRGRPRAGRSPAGSRRRGSRRRCGPRSRGRRSRARPASAAAASPAATRSCHSTRSRPVIASVTGCSTWSRVFISMK